MLAQTSWQTETLAQKRPSDRKFGLQLGGIVLLLALLPLIKHQPPRILWLILGGTLILLGWLSPHLLAAFNKAWMKLGLRLERIVTPVIMAVVFFGLFTTLGLVFRMMGIGSLDRRVNRNLPSYWKKRETTIDDIKAGFKRQF
jgi:hypothetical protein